MPGIPVNVYQVVQVTGGDYFQPVGSLAIVMRQIGTNACEVQWLTGGHSLPILNEHLNEVGTIAFPVVPLDLTEERAKIEQVHVARRSAHYPGSVHHRDASPKRLVTTQLGHRVVLPLVSRLLPEWTLRLLNRWAPVNYDPADGWTFWLDASYARWCRRHRGKRWRRNAYYRAERWAWRKTGWKWLPALTLKIMNRSEGEASEAQR